MIATTPVKVMQNHDRIGLKAMLTDLRSRALRTGSQSHSPIIVNEQDNSVMVLVPAGPFHMGDGLGDGGPIRTVDLDAYYIGVYAVTNRQYKAFIDATGHRPPSQGAWIDAVSVWQGDRYPDEYADHPVVCVNWHDAHAYTEWANCHLPTEAQWEKAARGPKGFIYPWGDRWDENNCRNRSSRGNGTTAPVYGYPEGVSDYGTWNQCGNIYEWCDDWQDPREPSHRSDRGCCWRYSDPAEFRSARRSAAVPGALNDFRGFRLCISSVDA